MRRIVACRTILVGILAAFLLSSPVRAQEPGAVPQDESPVPAQETPDEEAPLVLPPGVVTELPYARWTQHTGKAEEAVTLVQVQHNGVNRSTTGFVLRCDGFVLVPAWVTEAMKEGARISLSVTQAEGETLTAPLPVSARTNHATRRAEYGVLRVTGHHLRSLPMLSANTIQPGTPVRLMTAQPGDAAWECQATSVPALVGSLSGKKDQWTLAARPGMPATLSESAPVGSIVVDEESGAALGMVTQGGDAPVFSSFLYFYDVCRDMGLVPNRAVLAERKKMPKHMTPEELARLKPGSGTSGYTWIPGGPVRLWGEPAARYQRAYRTDVACTPGFFVSTNLVTNEAYRQWLLQQKVPRRPRGWERPDELATPQRHPQQPVVGATQEDAMLYAGSRNARLLTEVEWCRAAISTDTEWVRDTMAHWRVYVESVTWLFARRGRGEMPSAEEMKNNPALTTRAINAAVASFNDPKFGDNLLTHLLEIKKMTIFMGGHLPPQLNVIGARKQDVSIFGVNDVLMNAPEMVQGLSRELSLTQAPKLLPATFDPGVAIIHYSRVNDVTGIPNRYSMTVAEVQQLLQSTRLAPEDELFLTYYSLQASIGYTIPVPVVSQTVIDGKGRKVQVRPRNESLGMESGPLNLAGFRLAQ